MAGGEKAWESSVTCVRMLEGTRRGLDGGFSVFGAKLGDLFLPVLIELRDMRVSASALDY